VLAITDAFARVSRKTDSWVVVILLAISLGVNVYLGEELRRRPAGATPVPTITVGVHLSNLIIEEPSLGTKTRITWGRHQKPAFLYFFSPSCAWCTRNVRNIRALTEALTPRYRLIGVSLSGGDDLKAYLKRNNFQFPVYVNPEREHQGKLIVEATPLTVVVEPDGTVKDVWRGAYGGPIQKDIEAKLGVHLPGLEPVLRRNGM
jgi:peroxiredoxin